jgi:hypothetical protein
MAPLNPLGRNGLRGFVNLLIMTGIEEQKRNEKNFKKG